MLEQLLEKLLFACRWLLAPLYLGLSLALIALGLKFVAISSIHLLRVFMNAQQTDNDKILW